MIEIVPNPENMREATAVEQKSVDDYIKSISEDTGVRFGSLLKWDDKEASNNYMSLKWDDKEASNNYVSEKMKRNIEDIYEFVGVKLIGNNYSAWIKEFLTAIVFYSKPKFNKIMLEVFKDDISLSSEMVKLLTKYNLQEIIEKIHNYMSNVNSYKTIAITLDNKSADFIYDALKKSEGKFGKFEFSRPDKRESWSKDFTRIKSVQELPNDYVNDGVECAYNKYKEAKDKLDCDKVGLEAIEFYNWYYQKADDVLEELFPEAIVHEDKAMGSTFYTASSTMKKLGFEECIKRMNEYKEKKHENNESKQDKFNKF